MNSTTASPNTKRIATEQVLTSHKLKNEQHKLFIINSALKHGVAVDTSDVEIPADDPPNPIPKIKPQPIEITLNQEPVVIKQEVPVLQPVEETTPSTPTETQPPQDNVSQPPVNTNSQTTSAASPGWVKGAMGATAAVGIIGASMFAGSKMVDNPIVPTQNPVVQEKVGKPVDEPTEVLVTEKIIEHPMLIQQSPFQFLEDKGDHLK